MVGLPDFSFEAQKWIWCKFIQDIDAQFNDKTEIRSFVNSDLQSFNGGSHIKMNGRQIRNCLDAALALAHADSSALKLGHVKTILIAGEGFDKFLQQSISAKTTDRMTAINFRG